MRFRISPLRFRISPLRFLISPLRFLISPLRFLISPLRFLVSPLRFPIRAFRLNKGKHQCYQRQQKQHGHAYQRHSELLSTLPLYGRFTLRFPLATFCFRFPSLRFLSCDPILTGIPCAHDERTENVMCDFQALRPATILDREQPSTD